MRCRVFTEPQEGATYDDQLAFATLAEGLGFDAYFRSDHYVSFTFGDGLPGPTDAWTTLAGLARDTSTIRLGTLVSPATFRLPGPLAITVAQVDAMSGGRVELGLGAGWNRREHDAYGIPFPPTKERFDRLEEQLAVITGLWSTSVGERFSFAGRYYSIADSPALPKPVQSPRPPIVMGGFGATRTPMLAARFADEFNVPFAPVDSYRSLVQGARRACDAIGRVPTTLRASVACTVVCGEDDATVARRAAAVDRELGQLEEFGVAGTPERVADKLLAYGEAGAETVYLQLLDLRDHDHLRLLAAEVLPAIASAGAE
jgi:F420-dependent oxidoreductase-like protein